MDRSPYPPLKQFEEMTPLLWLAADRAGARPARERRRFRRNRPFTPTYEPYISTSFRPARGNC
jgi:hypothetical protein